jgi:YHS domain-containing protein
MRGKRRHLFLATLLSLAAATVAVLAKDQPSTRPTTGPAAAAATQPDAKPVNKFCAVDRDNEVDPKVTTVYKGKVIGFCCRDCIKDFQKDPEKYVKDLK